MDVFVLWPFDFIHRDNNRSFSATISEQYASIKKYISLRESYIDLAKSQSYILEIMMKDTDLQNLMPEYRDLSKDELIDKMRIRIIELTIVEYSRKSIYPCLV